MKAYEIQQFGMNGLRLTNRAESGPGPGQVLVRMRAFSLNFRDLMLLQGTYNPRLALPVTPGSDGVGEIIEIGSGVTGFKPGDRVTSTFFENWEAGVQTDAQAKTALGGGGKGVLAEFVCLDQTGVIKAPAHLTDEEAATLPCAALTAWHGLFEGAQIRPGETVVTLGTGGVSLFALQFATAAGARVIITSSSDEKLAKARELGAAETINYASTPDWEKAVRTLTGGVGADHIVEVGGAGTLGKSVKAVRRGGTISLIGALAGRGTFDPTPVLMNGIRVNGIFVGSREMFGHMNEAISHHQIHPVVDRVFEFEDARAAYDHMASGRHFGKIVIKI
jgi:NADPH:quinone reductase-like Zn-dependent oxidoreductase